LALNFSAAVQPFIGARRYIETEHQVAIERCFCEVRRINSDRAERERERESERGERAEYPPARSMRRQLSAAFLPSPRRLPLSLQPLKPQTARPASGYPWPCRCRAGRAQSPNATSATDGRAVAAAAAAALS